MIPLHDSVWELIKFRIKWIHSHYFKWTILPTWKYNYNISTAEIELEKINQSNMTLLEAASQLIKRQEGQIQQLETVTKRQQEKIRDIYKELDKYVQFFRNYGIDKKVLEMDFNSRSSGYTLVETTLIKKPNKKNGKRVGRKKKERKDRRKA